MDIVVDDMEIQDHLLNLIQLVRKGGGYVHPEISIQAINGDISVGVDGGRDQSEVLIALPDHLLIPEKKTNLHYQDGTFSMSPDAGELSDIQIQMAEQMLAIYTLQQKGRQMRSYCPWIAFADNPDIWCKVLEARSTQSWVKYRQFMDMCSGKNNEILSDTFVADNFFKSRTLGFHLAGRGGVENYLMPLTELLNHHWYGSVFDYAKKIDNDAEKSLSMKIRQPVENSNECFAFYGPLDSLDALLSYYFVDDTAPIVRSMPLTVEIGDVGVIHINSASGYVYTGEIPEMYKDLRLYIPEAKLDCFGEVALSHLIIPIDDSVHSMRVILASCIQLMGEGRLSQGKLVRYVSEAEDYIVKENIEFYRGLNIYLKKAECPSLDALELVERMIEVQLSKLDKYQSFESDHERSINALDASHIVSIVAGEEW